MAFKRKNFTKYLEKSNVFSFGKLRASYGEVGIGPDPYLTDNYITTGGVFSGWGDLISHKSVALNFR